MKLTRQNIAHKLIDYLFHRITLAELVNWAEMSMMEADFEDKDYETLRDIISRLGLADVKAFGISWEDIEDFLHRLGYRVDLKITEVQAV
ncbi:MAG: hypothetical protein HPY89_09670 [Pelotomaculum sp.]|uniref:Uncharacterized protein n=1 Tax=Pelotomaculum thermopropionicum (strain DSM 13744 / JCM 10971 / SI) TaxID=370438 RepID=A5D622_PELTS|nr:hypothetical protein [Pelotomaculum sp.]BAF58319.1 hypothetical protein PTH_0138 [Pelotomaculum thermopropionicum SI]